MDWFLSYSTYRSKLNPRTRTTKIRASRCGKSPHMQARYTTSFLAVNRKVENATLLLSTYGKEQIQRNNWKSAHTLNNDILSSYYIKIIPQIYASYAADLIETTPIPTHYGHSYCYLATTTTTTTTSIKTEVVKRNGWCSWHRKRSLDNVTYHRPATACAMNTS